MELDQFAYPNGDYSEREMGFVKEAGFASARTCDPGWNDARSDRFRLKGICIDDEASVGARLNRWRPVDIRPISAEREVIARTTSSPTRR
jgi:hypothetical protein